MFHCYNSGQGWLDIFDCGPNFEIVLNRGPQYLKILRFCLHNWSVSMPFAAMLMQIFKFLPREKRSMGKKRKNKVDKGRQRPQK